MIEQAKGVLMASQGCSADQAFRLLVEMSQRGHVKLHDVARDLVETARQQAAAEPRSGAGLVFTCRRRASEIAGVGRAG